MPGVFFRPPLFVTAPDILLCNRAVVDTEDDTEFSDVDEDDEEGVVAIFWLLFFKVLFFILSVILLYAVVADLGAIDLWYGLIVFWFKFGNNVSDETVAMLRWNNIEFY